MAWIPSQLELAHVQTRLSAIRPHSNAVICCLVLGSGVPGVASGMNQVDSASAPTIGSGPVADQFSWLLNRVNTSASGLTPELVQAHFHADFLASVPASKLVTTLQALAQDAAPLTVVEVIQQTEKVIQVQVHAGMALHW